VGVGYCVDGVGGHNVRGHVHSRDRGHYRDGGCVDGNGLCASVFHRGWRNHDRGYHNGPARHIRGRVRGHVRGGGGHSVDDDGAVAFSVFLASPALVVASQPDVVVWSLVVGYSAVGYSEGGYSSFRSFPECQKSDYVVGRPRLHHFQHRLLAHSPLSALMLSFPRSFPPLLWSLQQSLVQQWR